MLDLRGEYEHCCLIFVKLTYKKSKQFLCVHFSMLGNENVRSLEKCLLNGKKGGSRREWDEGRGRDKRR